ncbi:MAG TPA: ABC transporter substrate-binding protein [Dehalococcoidia bacterium]|nr:ABC transporter substrate-binding protein [Dehalococcoidia bacterium]
MGRWRVPLVLAAILAALMLMVACNDNGSEKQPAATQTTSGYPVSVTDAKGNRVTFDSAPQRIVVLSPGHVETLFAIGAGSSIVGVDQNTDYPPEAARLPKLSGFQPNLEAIAASRPDLVIMFYDPGDLQTSLSRLNIKSLLLATPKTVAGIFDQMEQLGQVTGHSREATDLRKRLEARIQAVTAKLGTVQQGPRVYHELDPGLFTACPGDFINDAYTILKAQNIAKSAGVPCQLSQEALIAANPQVIVLADEPAGVTVASVKARAGWASIAAVQNNAVYVVDADVFSRPGPRIVDAIEQLGKLLYPEKF